VGIEFLILSSILNFSAYLYLMSSVESEVLIFFILTVAVSESAFGLGLLLRTFHNKGSVDPTYLNDLN
jgi:NADH:ubiquinone oxidoreductase subunit K